MKPDTQLIALRDFFAAQHGRQVSAAAAAVQATCAGTCPDEDADELEFAFNRLFVGPAAPLAPPYASAYLDPERRLMGDTTGRAAAVYEAMGLRSALAGELPEDHLAMELDAALALRALVAAQPQPLDAQSPLALLRRYFIQEHMAKWIPALVADIHAAPDLPPVFYQVAHGLAQWLAEEEADVANPDAVTTIDPETQEMS